MRPSFCFLLLASGVAVGSLKEEAVKSVPNARPSEHTTEIKARSKEPLLQSLFIDEATGARLFNAT